MDDLEKKMFVQLDDPMPRQRVNALEMLREYMEKKTPPEFFRGWVSDLDELAQNKAAADGLRQQNALLDSELTQYKGAIPQWQQRVEDLEKSERNLRLKLAAASAIAWGKTTGLKLAAYIAVPLIALGIWQASVRYWPLPAPVDTGLGEIARSSAWADGCGGAVVREVGGTPYWVLLCGRTDTTSHMNAQGQPIGLHCLDLYATAAKADWQEYVKANPYALFGWWINWPKRAVQCEPFEIKEAQR